MDRKDEQLLQQFFIEASQQTIADNGFSERVMRRLPNRANWFNRVWTLGCILIAIALLLMSDAITIAMTNIEVFTQSLLNGGLIEMLPTISMLIFGLAIAGAYELYVCVKENL